MICCLYRAQSEPRSHNKSMAYCSVGSSQWQSCRGVWPGMPLEGGSPCRRDVAELGWTAEKF